MIMRKCTCRPGVIETRDIEHGGRTVTVTVVEDNMSSPHDADCYTAEDIAAWERGEWIYVGVLITGGTTEIDDLWGVEYGRLNELTTIDMDRIISDHPVPGMIEGK
jgi:hypothetical protein